jgi:hypothetical protein
LIFEACADQFVASLYAVTLALSGTKILTSALQLVKAFVPNNVVMLLDDGRCIVILVNPLQP